MQTRQHFQRVIAGFESDEDSKDIRWKEDFTRHPKKPEEDLKSSRKGKGRASLGGGKSRNSSKGKEKEKVSEAAQDDADAEQAAAQNHPKSGGQT